MKGILCAFQAITVDCERRSIVKTGKDCLALTVAREGDDETFRVWHYHTSRLDELCDQIKPGKHLYIEGVLKLKRWEDQAGMACAALSVTADRLEVLFDIDARPKPRAKTKPASASTTDLLADGRAAPKKNGVMHERPFDDPLPF